jgi:RecG-like helicase
LERACFYPDEKRFLKNCAQQQIQIVIGTHALIQKNVRLPHLGLAIIDEQIVSA